MISVVFVHSDNSLSKGYHYNLNISISLREYILDQFGVMRGLYPIVAASQGAPDWILKNIGSIPYVHGAEKQTWTGDHAWFIIDNLPLKPF